MVVYTPLGTTSLYIKIEQTTLKFPSCFILLSTALKINGGLRDLWSETFVCMHVLLVMLTAYMCICSLQNARLETNFSAR